MGHTDFWFRTAAAITRVQAAQVNCTCSAYKFPHRPGSCDHLTNEQTLDSINDEERALHDRAEARAINSGAW